MEASAPSPRQLAVISLIALVVAVAARVPSCYESFWVDELHSAWCVEGTLAEVFPRADRGHQSPFYFVGLWFWKQLAGDSELALRISSVIMIAASCAVLTIGVARWTDSLVAGLASGLVLALESNSLFFGTELRPYATVIFFTSIALVCFLPLSHSSSRHQYRRLWIGMVAAILLAVLCQPTAAGVLGCLPLALLAVWLVRDRRKISVSDGGAAQCRRTLRGRLSIPKISVLDGFVALAITVVGVLLWSLTIVDSWQQRQVWASFASATSVYQIWDAWPWVWSLLLPLVFLLLTLTTTKLEGADCRLRRISIATLLLAVIAIVATILYWVVARANWVPLWHRRYFIGVLPILACVVGGGVGAVSMRKVEYASSLLIAVLVGLTYQQGTIQRLPGYPVALVTRGEGWRSAMQWIEANASQADQIFVDAGLIEARQWINQGLTDGQRDYLLFVTSGPYRVPGKRRPIHPDLALPEEAWGAGYSQRIFLVTRRRADRVDVMAMGWPKPEKVLEFGNVTVVAFLVRE